MERELVDFVDALREGMTIDTMTALEACVGCGNCGTACPWFLETGDQELHPHERHEFIRHVHRDYLTFGGRLLRALGLRKGVTVEDLRQHREVFWKCSACGRCTLPCALSLSKRALFRWFRNAYAASGLSAENATRKGIMENTARGAHSFGVARERLIMLLGTVFSAHATEVPVDVPGADYLITFPTVDTLRFPDQLWKLFQLLNTAGLRYTTSSLVFDLGTEIDHVVVDHALSRHMLERVENEAARLHASTLIVPECGCDVRTFYVDAQQILGRPLRVRIESVDLILRRCLQTGELPVVPLSERVALHDPCQVTRLSGFGRVARDILTAVAPEYVELDPNRDDNYCCNGSSGPFRLPENTELRRRVSRLKAEQIRRAGVSRVTTPCAVCTLTLNDVCRSYQLSPPSARMVSILYEIVFEAVHAALARTRDEARARIPALLKGQPRPFWREHSLTALQARLCRDHANQGHLRWVLEHEAVKGRFEAHAEPELTPTPIPASAPVDPIASS